MKQETPATPQGHYYNLIISQLTPEEAEEAASLVFDFGAAGVSENLPFIQNNEAYDPVLIEQSEITLNVYFEKKPSDELMTEIKTQYPKARAQVFQEEQKDWMAEWKKFFKSFELTQGVWVVPAWLETPKEALHEIRIEPGMAFGTGTHETTRLASVMIAKELSEQAKTRKLEDVSFIDVGAGTAILSFLAEKLGVKNLVAVEIDPEARRSARENCEINHSKVRVVEEQIDQIQDKYDWVVANIIDGVLILLEKDLKRVMKPNGYLLLTGILKERDEQFLKRFSFDGFTVVEKSQLGEWVGYLLKANS